MNLKRSIFYLAFLSILLGLGSCDDHYIYNDGDDPEWLGSSIYDYLKEDGNFTTYVKLIEDAELKGVLAKTGSKTLFVAKDSSFSKFFESNPWGVNRYEDLTAAQKKMIIKYAMIDNAYLIETLSNYKDGEVLVEGSAMRRVSSYSFKDSIPFLSGDQLPDGGKYWNYYRENGAYLAKDNTNYPLLHFLPSQIIKSGITDEDFELITGVSRNANDAHIFDIKVIKRDITCKNGYINVLEDVLTPRTNMADFVQNNESTSIFGSILDRFCAPYYDAGLTQTMRELTEEEGTFGGNDSIFVKKFYAQLGGETNYPDNIVIKPKSYLLNFDPGWNSYVPDGEGLNLQNDMGAMLVPSDEAMDDYFNNGSGRLLKERYQTWDSIPMDIAALFVKRHMRGSFLSSIPSLFPKMTDAENSKIPIETSNVIDSYLGVNGVVYITNKVFPPDDYVSVYGPVLFSENAKIMNWVVLQNKFRLYLNAMVGDSTYSFFVPTDAAFEGYIDPYTVGKDVPAALKFRYDFEDDAVYATVYTYDIVNNVLGDSVGVVEDQTFINNRLLDILNNHIVVDDVTSGKEFYLNKAGCHVKVEGSGVNLKVQGGGDIVNGTVCEIYKKDDPEENGYYDQENGKTYFIDKMIQTPTRSTYSILSSDTSRYGEFLDLCTGFPANHTYEIFVRKSSYFGVDYSVKFFNTYHYTVWVPTNEAIRNAIIDGKITPWESRFGVQGINDMESQADREDAIKKLGRFLRYHFQDNSVIYDGRDKNLVYTSATIRESDGFTYFDTYKNKYFKIGVETDSEGLTLTTELGDKVSMVDKANTDQYNLIVRDFIFNNNPTSTKEVDGSGTGGDYSASRIYTSSTAVINQIEDVLMCEE